MITGDTQITSVGGTFVVKDIQFTASPGQNYRIKFVTKGIDLSKPSNKKYMAKLKAQEKNSSSSKADNSFKLNLNLRNCSVGESFLNSGKCKMCENKTQYSLV